jgi:hypothetical protein
MYDSASAVVGFPNTFVSFTLKACEWAKAQLSANADVSAQRFGPQINIFNMLNLGANLALLWASTGEYQGARA